MPNDPTITAQSEAALRVLQALDGAGHVSQRELADSVGLAPSHVNRTIRALVSDGYLEVANTTVRPFAYRVTGSGQRELRRLSYARYASVVDEFRRIQARIRDRLSILLRAGIRRVAFYGAGDIMDVTYPLAGELGLEVVAVVDDDPGRQGRRQNSLTVASPVALADARPDAVVITSFRHADVIRQRLEARSPVRARIVEL